MCYVHIKWLVVNFVYVFLLQLIEYYLLITSHQLVAMLLGRSCMCLEKTLTQQL